MDTKESIDAVEAVDRLMTQFRYGVTPTDAEIVKAYDLGINVKALKQYIEEVENGDEEQVED